MIEPFLRTFRLIKASFGLVQRENSQFFFFFEDIVSNKEVKIYTWH